MCLVLGMILLQLTICYVNVNPSIINKTELTFRPTESTGIGNSSKLSKREAANRIINGTYAKPGQFPGEISLRLKRLGSHICGGSIILESWVLTAAHCVIRSGRVRKLKDLIVVAGELRLKTLSSATEKRKLIRITPHPGYNSSPKGAVRDDLALLEVNRPFVFNDNIKARPLMDHPVIPGTACKIAGWGVDHPKRETPSHWLLYVDVPILDINKCRKWLSHTVSYIPDGTLCAGFEEGMKDACQGDSGGGLMCDGKLTGVVSWGKGCANPRSPGFYADVYYYSDWIEMYADSSLPKSNYDSSHMIFIDVWLLFLGLFLRFFLF